MVTVEVVAALVVVAVILGGECAAAHLHHVVGGDQGWDLSSDIPSWSAGRIFRVGDKIWFTYSAAHEKVVELKSLEEFLSCDVRNPIRMFTDGLDGIPLEEEGIRYFASTKLDSCKNGLRLQVDVVPQKNPNQPNISTSEEPAVTTALAAAPASPSASTQLAGTFILSMAGLWLSYMTL